MTPEVAHDSEYYTIEWDADLGVVVFTWNEYASGDQFRDSLDELHDAITEAGTDKYIVVTREITAHDAEDKQWIAETWIPRLIDSGVRSGASVYPDSAIADMDTRGMEEGVNEIDDRFTFKAFADLTQARNWIRSQ